ncbi:MAG: FeoB-associated Cys-rich membrane protein [Firmicutes bacterium]|nr:FeoB-associated Cys-rich membrane protein [Bacillota bacterium]
MWILVLAGIVAALVLIVKDLIKKAVKGETSCSCGCKDCAMHGECHKDK